MICQFSFKNFKSYKNETVFDFQAADLPEFKESLIVEEKGSPILPLSVIYGPNGGGKSNLLKALSCLITLVVKPIHELEKNRVPIIVQQSASCEPFSFDESSPKEPTEFNLYFRTNGNEYRYYIAIYKDQIISEALYRRKIGGRKTAMIYEREGDLITLGPSINKGGINTSVNPKMPYLSFLSINYNLQIISDVQSWFESCIICNYANFMTEHRILLSEDDSFKKLFIHSLNDMGIEITNYRFDNEEKQFFLQRIIDGIKYELSFSEESDGTKKLFSLLPLLLIALHEGRLIIVDELDAKLHPKLLRYIISLFSNRKVNKKGAQLLFTSHDMSTMKNDVFRRDEIWFAALDDEHSSDLYSLYEIRKEDNKRINRTAAYDKQYLEGRYGADPYLRNMMDWEDLQ